MQSGQIEMGDSEMAATNLYDVYEAHQRNAYLGHSLGAPRPAPRELIRFCLLGLGASIPPGWERELGRPHPRPGHCRELRHRGRYAI